MVGRRPPVLINGWQLAIGCALALVGFVLVSFEDASVPQLIVGVVLCLTALLVLEAE